MAIVPLLGLVLPVIVVFSLTLATGFILSKLMMVEISYFIMEIPPIRIPSLKNIVTKTSYRSLLFLREALPLFIIGALGLFLAEKIGLLVSLEDFFAPVVKGRPLLNFVISRSNRDEKSSQFKLLQDFSLRSK